MPSGIHIPPIVRRIIYNAHIIHEKSAEIIFFDLFLGDETVISLFRLKDICRLFDDEDRTLETNTYVNGKRTRKDFAGRTKKLDEEAQDYLKHLNSKHPSMTMRSLAEKFQDEYFIDPLHAPCPKSVNNCLHRFGLSRKKSKIEHRDLDPALQLEFLDEIGHIDPSSLVDIDGTMQRPKDFGSHFAWSRVGSPAIRQQIVICNTTYPIMAAFSMSGFLCWKIYAEEVSGEEVADFVNNSVRPMLDDFSFGILDNASNQKCDLAHKALELVFGGRFMHVTPYCPRLKPIEPAFGLVKRFIKKHEREGERDPIGLINRAFRHYSFLGDGRDACKMKINCSCIFLT
jgi:hypothetical protein